MTRRGFMQMPGAAAVAGGLNAAQNRRAGTGAKGSGLPNIILIMSDQMTPFMTSPYGQRVAHTPNLDRLAAKGTLFENAYCNSPLCVPSRMSMFTGRLPAPIAAYDNASELPAHEPTFMHYLRRAGYRTAVAGKCHFIGPDQLHGFDDRLTPCIFPSDFAMLPDWRRGAYYNAGTSVQAQLRMLGPSVWNRQLAFDEMTFDASLQYLRRQAMRAKKQPLFLNVSLTQPHDPFTTTQPFLDLYRNADIPLPKDHGDIRRLSPTYEWFIIHHGLDREKVPPERIREARRNYLGMISWVDDKVGRILNEMDRLGMSDNSVVVFTSDHGEMMGEHGQWSKRIMLEWASRVPMMVSGPGVPAGKRIGAPVSLLDLFGTFTDIAGAQVETPLDGRSLMPLLAGREDGTGRQVTAEYMGEGAIEPVRMVRYKQYKYITVNNYGPQLFDLGKDPEETVNLAGTREYAEIEKDLRARVEKDWDGPALKKSVIASQQARQIVRSMKEHGQAPSWAFDATEAGPFRF
ncbi:MAG: choline-sulfatase [Acidobacteria bacterium]|nr:choline-sulfatase [Acidobacteriota bacterium]